MVRIDLIILPSFPMICPISSVGATISRIKRPFSSLSSMVIAESAGVMAFTIYSRVSVILAIIIL